MADEEQSADATPAPEVTKKVLKKKTKRKAHKKIAKSSVTPIATSKAALAAVYIILGILVIGTSFYTGYLFGKNGTPSITKIGGAQNDKLQIIAYSDYECPFCSRVEPTIAQLKQAYGDKIEVIYKNFPLESIHQNALPAAIAAECARDIHGEEAFWTYHDTLFANQNALDSASLKKYAADQKLDTAKFNDCFDNKKTETKVRADMQEALGRGVQGTPSFWIKDELVVGALPYDMFKEKIDAKLSGAAPQQPTPQQPTPQQPSAKVDVAPGRYVMGDANAKVEIVEFGDFQCPFCQRFYNQAAQDIIKQYVTTGKAKLSYRHFPLPFHAQAQKAGEASECAGKQGKFWEMHDVLYIKGSGDGTGLDVDSLKKYAADLGLDTAKFNQCLDSGETATIVTTDMNEGQTAGVSGTPTVYVNGVEIVGAQPFSAFQAAIEAELN